MDLGDFARVKRKWYFKMAKGKTIYFTGKELETLKWIVPMYKDTHQDGWKEGVVSGEEPIVNKIIKKIKKQW